MIRALLLIAFSFALCAQENPLAGVIDFHCHSGPDVVGRSLTDPEIVRLARRSGMRGIVLKNHYTSTAARAQLAMADAGGLEVFGGVALNRAVGGINAEAVRRMLQMEGGRGKVVWLPTFDSQHQVTQEKQQRPFVAVVKDGKPVAELAEVFALVAKHGLVLATGHSSVDESLLVIAAAKEAGVRNIVVTHAMADPINANLEQLQRLAKTGAVIECVWNTHIAGPDAVTPSGRSMRQVKIAEYAKAIRAIGAQHFLIASDLGQELNPVHTDGLKHFIAELKAGGLTEADIDLVARRNPARLLGLAPR